MKVGLDNSLDLTLKLDSTGKVIEANKIAEVHKANPQNDEHHLWDIFESDQSDLIKSEFHNFQSDTLNHHTFDTKITFNEQAIYLDCTLQKNSDNKDEIIFIARDISAYKSEIKQLQRSQEEVRKILKNAREMVIFHELDGKFKYVSDAAGPLTGYLPEELIGAEPYKIIHPEDVVHMFEEPNRNKLMIEPMIVDEFRIIKKDGSTNKLESFTKPVFNEKEELQGFQSSWRESSGTQTDDEKYRKVNEKLSQYREGLKLLSEITANADLSVEMQIQEALGVTTEFFGMTTGVLSRIDDNIYTIENVYSFSDLKPGQGFELSDTYAEIVYRKNELVAVENMSKSRYRTHPCYDIFKLESYIGIPYFVSGKFRGTIDFYSAKPRTEAFDINELDFLKLLARWIGFLLQQHEYEKNLIADKIMLQAFVSSAPAAIAMFDSEFQYLAASDKWYTDYDLEDEFIIGRSHFDVFPDNGQDWEKIFRSALKGNVERNDEDLLEKNDGEIKWIKWEVRPWFKKLDTVGGLIMHTEDITHQKEQQLQLKIAKRKAEQASKAKEQFLSTMSHEIRTPLNAILGMTEIMMMDERNEEKLKHLKLLQFSGQNLLALINDILDFNKIEAGKLELEQIDFNFKELIERIRDSLDNLAQKKGLTLQVKYDTDLPSFFKGDAIRLGQVLTNLANNAIKFTEDGYVAIKAALVQKKGQSCIIRLEVKDTGIGIPKTKIDKIFKSFEQASSDITRKYGGTGLGLSITKKIVELMGSNIKVNSSEGVGSVFYFEFELPLGEQVESLSVHTFDPDEMRDDIRLLVAEDNPGNRILIESLFKRWELDYEFAFNGLEAVEKIQSKRFNMILMDLQMPEMDGYMATKEIRKMEDEYFQNLPIIALTASVMSNVLEKTKKVGMNGYISKPFNPGNLRDTIIKFTNEFKIEQYVGKVTDTKNEEIQQKVIEETEEQMNGQEISADDFPYIKELVGDDLESLKEIVATSLESVIDATNGVESGLKEKDISKIRGELHVLRPNLHNLELGKLVDDVPKVTELTDDSQKALKDLIETINNELSTDKYKPYRR